MTNLEARKIGDDPSIQTLMHNLRDVAPGSIRRSPRLTTLKAEGGDEIVDGHGDGTVGDTTTELRRLNSELELAILRTRSLDIRVLQVLEANLLQVLQLADRGEIRSGEIALLENLHLGFLIALGTALLVVELETSVQDRLVLHVEKLIVVSLEDILEDFGAGDAVTVKVTAEQGFGDGVGVGSADADILGGRVRLGALMAVVAAAGGGGDVGESVVVIRVIHLLMMLATEESLDESGDVGVFDGHVAKLAHVELDVEDENDESD